VQAELAPLVAFLRALPIPSTHPSHPAAPAILTALKDALRGYADMRGGWARRCVEDISKKVVDRAEKAGGAAGGREMGQWAFDLLSVIDVRFYSILPSSSLTPLPQEEWKHLTTFSPLASLTFLEGAFASLLAPICALFGSTLSQLTSLLKRSLHAHTFLALSSYDQLSALQPRWEEVINARATRREHELRDGVHAIRAACVRSFPEFLADIKAAGLGPKNGEMTTDVADFTISVCSLLDSLGIRILTTSSRQCSTLRKFRR
jgi:exocyst complex protein 7